MEMYTPVHLYRQVEEIAQWIENAMHCKQRKVNVLALGKKKSAKLYLRFLSETDPDLASN